MTITVVSHKHKYPKAPAEEQLPYWVEIQLVDEQGNAVPEIPWKAESYHPGNGRIDQFTYTGRSDVDGLIRIDMPHGLELKLTLDADSLTKEMETRHLRPGRDAETDSTIRQQTEDSGLVWHYAVLGELCETQPSVKLNEGEVLPSYHFPPDKSFKGFPIRTNELEKRHVVEICPFRTWELVLHHQKGYSIANAINLGGASYLSYSNNNISDKESISNFFINQCQDLSKLPIIYKANGFTCNCLVQDVPFSNRYNYPVFMDTSQDTSEKNNDDSKSGSASTRKENESEKADGDTQLFYVYNADKLIISWRGTASVFDVGTDLAFRPVNSDICGINKTKCNTLLTVGRVHTGFWSGYSRVEKKFFNEIQKLSDLAEALELYVCGHSLGGALALIHAAKLKNYSPLLYTYGMPRTFTRDAVEQLSDIIHFRHVNDNDPVPAVPPEANLDNELYKLWGPAGGVLGFFWSLGELLAYQMTSWGDCFWHHGRPVVFLTATQSREWKECKVSLPTPSGCITIRKLLPVKAKLYLVPAIAEQKMQEAGQQQKEFKASLTLDDLNKFFPAGQNPNRGVNINGLDHLMTAYMPYIQNKLLELIDKTGIVEEHTFTEHQYNIDKFREQMRENKSDIPDKEFARNEIFLAVEGLLGSSLSPTLSSPCGNDTLLRFSMYSEEVMENI